MQALIVIDVQNDFCPGGALAVPEGDQIIAGINSAMQTADLVVLTQDWHPASHRSFASAHSGASPFDVTQMPYGDQVLWPDHCVQGSPGAAFHPDLEQDRAQIILRKGTNPDVDSYSAFFENDRVTTTGLDGYLRAHRVSQVTLAGLAFDFCVAYSALDAVRLGYQVSLRQDLCRAIDLDGSAQAARSSMQEAGVALV